jgi:hypothetical protein
MPYHCPSPPTLCARCQLGLCHGCEACGDRGGHLVARRRFDSEVVLISGARRHANAEQVHNAIDTLPSTITVVTGLADGVDTWADHRAKQRGMRVLGIAANWKRWWQGAGQVRNEEMVVASDRILAFPWWGCRGTWDAISRAKSYRIKFDIIDPRCANLQVWTMRMSANAAQRRPDFLDITARTAREAWQLRRGRWHRDMPPERLFAELADAAHKLVDGGMSIAQAAKALREDGAPSLGAVFAPTHKLLRPALEARERASQLAAGGNVVDAVALETSSWTRYASGDGTGTGFMAQMSASRRRYAAIWGLVASQPSVSLACFCSKPAWWPADTPWDHHCHRYLVAKSLEGMGGVGMGEVGQETSAQLSF